MYFYTKIKIVEHMLKTWSFSFASTENKNPLSLQ